MNHEKDVDGQKWGWETCPHRAKRTGKGPQSVAHRASGDVSPGPGE